MRQHCALVPMVSEAAAASPPPQGTTGLPLHLEQMLRGIAEREREYLWQGQAQRVDSYPTSVFLPPFSTIEPSVVASDSAARTARAYRAGTTSHSGRMPCGQETQLSPLGSQEGPIADGSPRAVRPPATRRAHRRWLQRRILEPRKHTLRTLKPCSHPPTLKKRRERCHLQ